MSSVLFYDPACRAPYDTRTLASSGLGGTESTLVRVADALDAWVIQHNRTEDWGRYRCPQPLEGISTVIVNREAHVLPLIAQQYPGARIYLWLHDRLRPGGRRAGRLAARAAALARLEVTAICVSDWQRGDVERTLQSLKVARAVRACTIYNPVDDGLVPDGTAVDANKLVFFSSPNKGLPFALDAFAALRHDVPDLRLAVFNPGYKSYRGAAPAGVEFLGSQPAARVHLEVRSSLCTFFPNFVIPETFGLVFAESHALGTPVLTHPCGAAAEVVADPAQLLPVPPMAPLYEALAGPLPPRWRALPAHAARLAGVFDGYRERIRAWRSGARPRVTPDARFRLSAVSAKWRELLSV
jgi:glycosyltransferase involved in cell wall biosynthesis